MVLPPLVIFALIGKCAETSLIVYLNFFSTPSKRLLMWLHALRSMESCFDFAKYMRTRTSCRQFANHISMGRCLKSRLRVPFLPVTSTILDLMLILMPLGTLTLSSWTKVFIFEGRFQTG